jgi:hypothetical protein
MNSGMLHIAGIVSAALAAGGLVACGQAAGPMSTPEPESSTDALNTVIGCQDQAFACAADAQAPSALPSCNSGLRACLASLIPDAGALPTLPAPPTLTLPTLPTFPTLPGFDGGFPLPIITPPAFDAGLPVRRFDAGVPVPPPVVLPDAGAPSQVNCLTDLQICLTTTPDATKCAADARTCLTAVDQARCDAQEAACTASGAPKVLCDAQRAACL